jgi:quercetin dioxygenase-like cupin family protein
MEAMLNPTVLTADDVDALTEVSLGSIEGVAHRVVWQLGESMAGRMTIDGGHHLGSHQHRRHAHHMWILDGHVEILGAFLGAGSYVHIPPGVLHDLDARATEGCTLFYVYET